MEAKVVKSNVTVTLEMTLEELQNIVRGIGVTSHFDRKKIGMSENQSRSFQKLYDVLEVLVEQAN